ncbi:MAG TPA: methylated-DNA--[protein]-cysteine S-methyltransferase [Methylomirabilota bacterium]|jgi:methylated-DNA-[protein]-cysteine S-methyltransferase|nr:methylated-DNA--[protein]-cysteine S-methyltransferase [Methylomirabilota bacterium]
MSEATYYTRVPSPLGLLLLVGTADALTAIWLPSGRDRLEPDPDWIESDAPFAEAVRQLDAYFAGALRRFDLPLAPEGTPFQRQVWQALREIPYGETVSYGEVARRIGRPSAVRAVGAANGQNPLSIVIPCHRVIGSDGRLVGYGGGLPAKTALLELERRGADAPDRPVRPRQGALFA